MSRPRGSFSPKAPAASSSGRPPLVGSMLLLSTALGLVASSASAGVSYELPTEVQQHQQQPSSTIDTEAPNSHQDEDEDDELYDEDEDYEEEEEEEHFYSFGECHLSDDPDSCLEMERQQQDHGATTGNNRQQQQQSSHKQQQNHTQKDRDGKHVSKDGTVIDNDKNSKDPLLSWLSDKMVPESKQCGVYLAPSTIPGAGLGMFAGRTYKRSEIVTDGDIIIPLSEIDWHNGFMLDFFLWEEYTWRYVYL